MRIFWSVTRIAVPTWFDMVPPHAVFAPNFQINFSHKITLGSCELTSEIVKSDLLMQIWKLVLPKSYGVLQEPELFEFTVLNQG